MSFVTLQGLRRRSLQVSSYAPAVISQAAHPTGSLRVMRSCVLATAMLVLTSVAHVAAHGMAPSSGSLALLLPITLGLSAIAVERRRGYVWLAAFAIGVQALLHILLTVTATHDAMHASLLPSTGMLLAHTGAAVATALVLAHGDNLLHRWIDFARTLLLDHTPAPLQPTAPARALPFTEPALRDAQHLASVVSRRGPPALIST
jgi:hypothetical protein